MISNRPMKYANHPVIRGIRSNHRPGAHGRSYLVSACQLCFRERNHIAYSTIRDQAATACHHIENNENCRKIFCLRVWKTKHIPSLGPHDILSHLNKSADLQSQVFLACKCDTNSHSPCTASDRWFRNGGDPQSALTSIMQSYPYHPYHPAIPLLCIHFKEMKLRCQIDICTLLFIAVLSTISKIRNQCKIPSMDKLIKKMRIQIQIYIIERK